MAESIFRDPTQAEKQDMVVIETGKKKKSILEAFKEKAEAVQQSYVDKEQPFCYRCARFDFMDNFNKNMTEMERSATYETDMDKYKIKFPNWEEYAKSDRFVLKQYNNVMDPGKWKGDVQKLVTYKEYKCLVRGCGIAIQLKKSLSDAELEEITKKLKSK